jgi:hypothetical protein
MSLVLTTLTAAVLESDSKIAVTAATGIAIGYQVRVGDETMQVAKAYVAASLQVPVLRGQAGTLAKAHASGTSVVAGTASDFAQSTPPQTTAPFVIAGRARVITEYSAAGAITLPPAGADALAVINGTALAMTLAVPTKDMDGCVLTIIGRIAAAHVITIAGGLGGGALVTATFEATNGRCNFQVIAYNEIWYPLPSPLSGTLTSVDVAMT